MLFSINDPVEFTESCMALGAAKCRASNKPAKVVGINKGKYTNYLVDTGLGYCVHVAGNEIRPFKSSLKEEAKKDEKEIVCQA